MRPSLSWLMRATFVAGVALRVALCFAQLPFNMDDHLRYITYLGREHHLPMTHEFQQAQHPFLYYLLAALLLPFGSVRGIQTLSLAFSIIALVILYRFLRGLDAVREGTRALVFACLALFPTLVFCGNFISNDAASFCFGALAGWQLHRYLAKGSTGRLVLLAACTALALATKLIFLVALPVWVLAALTHEAHARPGRRALHASLLVAIAVAPIAYKLAQNAHAYGHALQSWLDFRPQPAFVAAQQGTNQGLRSWLDLDVLKMIRDPRDFDRIRRSFFLLLYWTFWQPYPTPPWVRGVADSTLYVRCTSVIYACAIVPSLVFVTGALRILRRPPWSTAQRQALFALLTFLSFVAFVFYGGLKYDVWSYFQGRYLLNALPGLAFVGAVGWDAALSRRVTRAAGLFSLLGLAAAYAIYLLA